MKLKKMLKGLIGVVSFLFFLSFIFLFSFKNIDATAITYCKDGEIDKVKIAQMFGISMDKDTYEIKRDCGDQIENEYKKVPLFVDLEHSSFVSSVSDNFLTCDKKGSQSIKVTPQSQGVATIALKAVKSTDLSDDSNDVDVRAFAVDNNSCYIKNPSFVISVEFNSSNVEKFQIVPYTFESFAAGQYIDCEAREVLKDVRTGEKVSFSSPSFEDSFCKSKERAEVTYVTEGHNGDNVKNDTQKFKCDYKIDSNTITDPALLKEDKYFTNLHSTFAEKKQNYYTDYVYHYSPSNTVTKSVSCEVTCQEAVDVEYGPPVASRAGMCFEYKVRVTSRVVCGMTVEPDVPSSAEVEVCTPAPTCMHGDVPYEQGGPNEAFDSCIKKCDNGKYSKKCSNKCYQEVYGSISATAKVNSSYFNDFFTSKVSQSVLLGNALDSGNTSKYCNGYYDWAGNKITWTGRYGNLFSPGRWYCTNNNSWSRHADGTCGNYGVYEDDGFFRQTKTGGGHCGDECSWGGCSKNQYLNESFVDEDGTTYSIQGDYDENVKRYEDLVKKCSSKATCSTTEATFTISAGVNREGGTVTYDFPYSKQKDTITHYNNDIVASTQNNDNTTLLPDYPYQYNGLWGCYRDSKLLDGDLGTGSDRYRSTWSFPGSWMNLKTGEVSYTPKDKTCDGSESSCVWYEHDHRFCIPLDAKNVNVTWWALYTQRKIGAQGLSLSTSSTKISEICDFNSEHSFVNVKESDLKEEDITWNINAKTTNFGYFDWSFDISCFYAINDNPLCSHSCCEKDNCPTDEPDECKPEAGEYRVRTTDPEDLFPSEDGTIITTPTEAGRIPGYNWSEYAINNKNEHYQSNPVEYMKQIQNATAEAKKLGTEIYNEGNLDYMFILSPKTLRQMRKDRVGTLNSQNNYAAFDDDRFTLNSKTFGIARYRSDKIRDLGTENKIPEAPQLYCNNMFNWKTTKCDTSAHGIMA